MQSRILPKNDEPKKRVRWITQDEANRFLDSLNLEWMREVCSFALLTGARMSKILTLTWDKIRFFRAALPLSQVTLPNLATQDRYRYRVMQLIFYGKKRQGVYLNMFFTVAKAR